MFRVDPENRFKGPHQDQDAETRGSVFDADVAMILIHGRGASAQSILTLADELQVLNIHYVAPQADRFTWYPYSFLVPEEHNQPGLNSALQAIHDRVVLLEEQDFPLNRIILAGFSQGACLVSEFAARHPAEYGGVIALSGGLIGEAVSMDMYTGSLEKTPVFLGCSDTDPHIPKERVDITEDVFLKLGARVTKKIYPGMPHSVNQDELKHAKKMIRSVRTR